MDRNTTLAPSPSPKQKGEPQQVTPPPPTESNTNKVRETDNEETTRRSKAKGKKTKEPGENSNLPPCLRRPRPLVLFLRPNRRRTLLKAARALTKRCSAIAKLAEQKWIMVPSIVVGAARIYQRLMGVKVGVALTPSPNHSSKDINSEVEILDGMPWGMARLKTEKRRGGGVHGLRAERRCPRLEGKGWRDGAERLTWQGYPNPAMAAVAPVMVIEGAVGVAEAGVEKAANSIGLANRARANSSKLGAIEGIMVELVVAGVAIAMPGGSVLVAVSSGLRGVAMGLVRSYTGVLGLLLGAMVSVLVELAHGEGKERERDVTGVKGVRVVWLFGEVTGVEGVKGSLVVW
nr:hypothetical protein Itr_chr10CG10460 [Ipomoea trifida]